MTRDSTWLDKARAMRAARLTAPLGFLFACVLLAGLPATASATTPEARGEWSLTVSSAAGTLHGKALITEEANSKGEFAAKSTLWESAIDGTFTGTLEGSAATVKTTSEAYGPVPAGEFNSKAMVVDSSGGSLSLSGEGELVLGGNKMTASETLTRIRTYKQIEEQEEQERKEAEERLARAAVRGEWALTLESGPEVVKGTAFITEEANSKNEFSASDALFENAIPGTFSGTLEGDKATVKITTDAFGSYPEAKFTSTDIAVTSASNPASMTGSGELTFVGPPSTATLTATRIKTYQQVLEREATEREAKEKQEKEEQEAKAKAEQEAKEKAEREAKAAQEAKAAKEKQEQEAAKKALIGSPEIIKTLPLVSAEPTTKTSSTSSTGSLALALENPNDYAVQGHVSLTFAKVGKPSGGKHKASKKQTVSLGSASFSLSSKGTGSVKVRISSSARAELARLKILHVIITLTTEAAGQTTTTKTFDLTLHAAKSAHGKR